MPSVTATEILTKKRRYYYGCTILVQSVDQLETGRTANIFFNVAFHTANIKISCKSDCGNACTVF